MTSDDDLEFEHAVRTMLERRAADVGERAAGAAEPSYVVGTAGRARSRRRWLIPAAAVVVAALGVGIAIRAWRDDTQTVALVGRDPTDVAFAVDAGLAFADVPLFVGGADAALTARQYLTDRFGPSSPEFTLDDPQTSADRAVIRYSIADGPGARIMATGTLRLRLVDAAWQVMVASTDGVRFDDLRYDGARLRGRASTTDETNNYLTLDVLDERGAPVPGAQRPEGLGAPDARFLFGTAADGHRQADLDIAATGIVIVRSSRFGGGRLSISEFSLHLAATSTTATSQVAAPSTTTRPPATATSTPDAPTEGPSSGGWWHPPRWTSAGEEEGATDPLADGRYVGVVMLVDADTISFDLTTTAPSTADREAAVALGLLSKDESESDGAVINRTPRQRVMRVAADAVLRRLQPFGTANLVTVPRSELASLVEVSARSRSMFHVDVRGGVIIAMDERYRP